jgi:cell division protein FtsN
MAARRNRKRTGGRDSRSLLAGALLTVLVVALAAGAWFYRAGRQSPLAAPERVPSRAAPKPKPAKPTAPMPKSGRFEFYEMLPKSELVIPDTSAEGRPDTTPNPMATPGVYVLQAGAYATFEEADRVKARLALLGVASQIQRIAVEDRQFHRVRIGPIENLDELNKLRRRLRDAKIDAMLIRAGE